MAGASEECMRRGAGITTKSPVIDNSATCTAAVVIFGCATIRNPGVDVSPQ